VQENWRSYTSHAASAAPCNTTKDGHRAQANVVEVSSGRVSRGGKVFQLVGDSNLSYLSYNMALATEQGEETQSRGHRRTFTDNTLFNNPGPNP
jgi:hypothetical protein